MIAQRLTVIVALCIFLFPVFIFMYDIVKAYKYGYKSKNKAKLTSDFLCCLGTFLYFIGFSDSNELTYLGQILFYIGLAARILFSFEKKKFSKY